MGHDCLGEELELGKGCSFKVLSGVAQRAAQRDAARSTVPGIVRCCPQIWNCSLVPTRGPDAPKHPVSVDYEPAESTTGMLGGIRQNADLAQCSEDASSHP